MEFTVAKAFALTMMSLAFLMGVYFMYRAHVKKKVVVDTQWPIGSTITPIGVEVIYEKGQSFKIKAGEKIVDPLLVHKDNHVTIKPYLDDGRPLTALKMRQWMNTVRIDTYLKMIVADDSCSICVMSIIVFSPVPLRIQAQPQPFTACFEAIDVKTGTVHQIDIPFIHSMNSS